MESSVLHMHIRYVVLISNNTLQNFEEKNKLEWSEECSLLVGCLYISKRISTTQCFPRVASFFLKYFQVVPLIPNSVCSLLKCVNT